MADNTIDRLLEAFLEASGGNLKGAEPEPQPAGEPARQSAYEQASNLYPSSANPVGSSVRGTASSAGQGSGGSTAGSIATTFLESGLGIASVVEGLVGLFTGGSSNPAPLQKYEMPSAIDFVSAETGSGLTGADYDASGNLRPAVSSNSGAAPGPSNTGAGTQITVNVQTMDAQSFLDHGNIIAQAVRGAMLNSNSINDVVNEL
jgi:hypothetical protein